MTNQFPGATKMVPSPAAQAVLHAFNSVPYYPDGNDEGMLAAAVLRAIANQVVPETHAKPYLNNFKRGEWVGRTDVRYELLDIANELEDA